jgi:ribonucleoside-triphosphate reductase
VEQTNSALLNENANKDSKVIPTQRDLLAGIVAKHYARQHLLPRDVVWRTSAVRSTTTISTIRRSSRCSTAC